MVLSLLFIIVKLINEFINKFSDYESLQKLYWVDCLAPKVEYSTFGMECLTLPDVDLDSDPKANVFRNNYY